MALRVLCEREDPIALFELGRLCYTGYVEVQNRKRGLLLIFRSASLGCRAADCFLHSINPYDIFLAISQADAEGFFEDAVTLVLSLAQRGDPDAYYVYGTMVERRAYGTADAAAGMKIAWRCYEEAARRGSADARKMIELLEFINYDV